MVGGAGGKELGLPLWLLSSHSPTHISLQVGPSVVMSSLTIPLPKGAGASVLRPCLPPAVPRGQLRLFLQVHAVFPATSQIPQVQKLCLPQIWTPAPKAGTELNLAVPSKSLQAY